MQNQRSSTDTAIVATLLVGRLVFLLFSPAGLSGDAFNYVHGAQTIIDTGRLPPLFVYQPRGFSIMIAPLLFAIRAGIARAVLLMNSIMDCGVVAILFHSAKKIFPLPDQGAYADCAGFWRVSSRLPHKWSIPSTRKRR